MPSKKTKRKPDKNRDITKAWEALIGEWKKRGKLSESQREQYCREIDAFRKRYKVSQNITLRGDTPVYTAGLLTDGREVSTLAEFVAWLEPKIICGELDAPGKPAIRKRFTLDCDRAQSIVERLCNAGLSLDPPDLSKCPDSLAALNVYYQWAKRLDPGQDAGEGAAKQGKTRNKRSKATVNIRMMERIQSDPDARGWTSPRWAKELKCAKSTVVDTDTWKSLAMLRKEMKAQSASDRRQKGKPTMPPRG